MFNRIYNDIQNLFNSEVTTYQISKATGLAQPSLDNYRSGKSDIKNMKLSVAEKLHNFINKERLEMEKLQAKIVGAIADGMNLYGTTEGLTIKEVAERNEVEVNQVIEFLGYEGESFVVDENGYEVINGDVIYIIAPDAEELTADQIASVVTGRGGQGNVVEFKLNGLVAEVYIDTDYYEWYDGAEVDENFVRDNFTQIMEDIEDKEVEWSIQN